MAILNVPISIKSSLTGNAPPLSNVAYSELTYSHDRSNDGSNAILYIGSVDINDESVIHKIGGEYYTRILDTNTHLPNINALVRRDGDGNFAANVVSVNNIITVSINGNPIGDLIAYDENGSLTANVMTVNEVVATNIETVTLNGQDIADIVARDGNGSITANVLYANNLSVTTINGNVVGDFVSRDANGDFSANLISATVTESVKLKTARHINVTGNVFGSGSFDGTANVNIITTLANVEPLTVKVNVTDNPGIATDETILSLGKYLQQFFKYTFNSSETGLDPGSGFMSLADNELLSSTNIVYLSHDTQDSLDLTEFLTSIHLRIGGSVKFTSSTSPNFLMGLIANVNINSEYTAITLNRTASSTGFDSNDTICFEYIGGGSVGYNFVTQNLEVAGQSIGPTSSANVQQFFKYIYDDTTNSTADPGRGVVRFNNNVLALANTCYIDNLTNEVTNINIKKTLKTLLPGNYLDVFAKESPHFGTFKVSNVVDGGGYLTISFSSTIDSIDFNNAEEVYVSVRASGNMEYNTISKAIVIGDEIISGISTANTFDSLPAANITANDNEVFYTLDPGIWMQCDGTLDAWVPFNNLGRLYRNPAPIRSTGPATQASAIANNGSGNTRVTANSHLMTATQDNYSVYISSWTGTGVAGRYRVAYVDANAFDLPDLPYNAGLGLPNIALQNGTDKILAAVVDLPPLTGQSVVKMKASAVCTGSADAKRIIWTLMNPDGSGATIINNRNTIGNGNGGEIVDWAFRNLGNTSYQQASSLLAQGGAPATLGGTPMSLAIDTSGTANAGAKIEIYNVLQANAAFVQNYTINDVAIYIEN